MAWGMLVAVAAAWDVAVVVAAVAVPRIMFLRDERFPGPSPDARRLVPDVAIQSY